MEAQILRDFITKNGPIEIGPVSISYDLEGDIDVKIDGGICAWVSYTRDQLESASLMTNFFDRYKDVVTIEDKPMIEAAPSEETLRLRGVVEAYEKLLIGRGVTISA